MKYYHVIFYNSHGQNVSQALDRFSGRWFGKKSVRDFVRNHIRVSLDGSVRAKIKRA